jgi:hypothetical protein
VELYKNGKQMAKQRLKTEPKAERTEFGLKMKEKALSFFWACFNTFCQLITNLSL